MRTLALRALIGSITLSALTGIYVLIVGGDGDLEGKILATALSISALSILVMACGVGLERRKLGLVPHAGTVAGVVAFILFMIVFWEFGSHRVWVQCALSLALASAAAALACLLSIADLDSRFRWVRALGFFCDAALATMLILFIWDLLDTENDIYARMTGVLAILVGAVTIAVPILQRMSNPEERSVDRVDAGDSGMVHHCVACGQAVSGAPETAHTCLECGVRFRVEFLHGKTEGSSSS
jgi:hypothetical protein